MLFTTFASGSGGNCALLSMDGCHLLLDAGISFRRIRSQLSLTQLRVEDLSAVLITHEHSDHIAGLASMLKCCTVPILAPRTVANHLRCAVAGVEQCLREVPVGEPISLGPLTLRAFHTPHDTPESVGWRVEGSECFALATDMGCATEEVRAGLTGADLALIEANHDEAMLLAGRYPYPLKRRILSDHGHLSNENCGALAVYLAQRGTRQLVLGHLSRENNSRERAYQTVKAALGDLPADLYIAPEAERLTVESAAGERKQPCSL